MKLVLQRVLNSSVEIDGNIVGNIDKGFLVLLGVGPNDTESEADWLVTKLIKLRVFEDENGKMNLSLKDVNGQLLVVSQFTLYADCTSGNRPSFSTAAAPEKANELYEYFVEKCKNEDIKVETGKFGADMKVKLTNDGPVTIILEK